MFKKFLYFVLIIVVTSCATDDLDSQLSRNNSTSPQDVITIDINTTRNPYNLISSAGSHSDYLANTRSSNDDDPFVEERIVESSESVVLPELTPHVFLGNIMRRSSIVDCQYMPLVSVNPISVALTLLNTTPGTINNTYTAYINYINNQTAKGTYSQNNEFYFSVEQFTSYNELKSTFGNNSNTSFLFWGSSSSSEHEERHISKATGIYLKFWQTSFKAVMDYPGDLATQVPQNLLDSLVYINSITYGRLGIMTLETNSTAAYAKTILTDSYNTIMTKGGSYLTQEQREFLDGCEFKVYLIYANGRAGVETIYGLDGFVNCIKKGVFTKDNPGGPLFCTFNNVKDNSPVKVRFKYNIRREPLYVEMKYINNGGLKLYFYRNAAKVPTIADPRMVFRFRRQLQNWGGMGSPLHGGPWGANDKKKYVDETKEIQNAGYQTSVEVYNKNLVGPNFSYDTSGSSVPAWTADRIRVEILPSDNYKIIGSTFYGDEFLCPVDLENNKFYPPFSGNVYVF